MKEFAWVVVDPDGHWDANSRLTTEEDAWAGEGCFTEGAIKDAEARCYRCLRVRLFEVGPA